MFFTQPHSSEFGEVAPSYEFGAVNTTVSLFSFQWILPTSPTVFLGWTSWRETHEKFNQLFVNAFPRLLYTVPFSMYTDEGWYSETSIQCSAETSLSPEQTKQRVIQLAEQAGFRGDLSRITFSQKTIQQLEAGENLVRLPSVVNTKDLNNATKTIENIQENGAVGLAGNALFGEDVDILGYKVPKYAVVFGAVLGGLYIIKK